MDPAAETRSRYFITAGVWIIAVTAIGYVLNQGADILTPFALAAFIWLVMEGFANTIRTRIPAVPVVLAHTISIAVVLGGVVGFVSVMRGAIAEFAQNAELYEERINALIAEAYQLLRLHDAPTLSELFYSDATARFIEPIVSTARSLASNLILMVIYIAFLYISSTTFSAKLDAIFKRSDDRTQANSIGEAVRSAMEQYLSVQTVLSLITTLLTYATLLVMGLDNALFWSVVIFILNYIPTIGSIFAAALPALFAIAQPEWPAYMPADPLFSALVVLIGVSAWQFVIGNFLGPRMMGESLNLDPLAVLLSLAIWGAIWGIPGMFLSAPLTVLVMIILSHTPGARWIAVILSADGRPSGREKKAEKRLSTTIPPSE